MNALDIRAYEVSKKHFNADEDASILVEYFESKAEEKAGYQSVKPLRLLITIFLP